MSDALDDDGLVSRLRAMFDEADPVPPEVVEAGKQAITWRAVDAELAELLADSVLDGELAGTRSRQDTSRHLSFAAPDLTIDVQVDQAGGERRLLGQLAPASAASVAVELEVPGTVVTAAADLLGRFKAELPQEARRIRLRITRSDASKPVVATSWLTL